ncbi:hypothetical protein G9A89_006526 [Geosiphon pyriformis]|nr:hypothetical protein G9A89_006526 [Geosiphon pyriformis]
MNSEYGIITNKRSPKQDLWRILVISLNDRKNFQDTKLDFESYLLENYINPSRVLGDISESRNFYYKEERVTILSGVFYFLGIGRVRDVCAATDRIRATAWGGNPIAQYLMFIFELEREDPLKQISWCQHSAEAGFAPAQYEIARYFYREVKDIEKGLYWLTKSAEQGFELAQEQLLSIKL